jgi:hypothetical protein
MLPPLISCLPCKHVVAELTPPSKPNLPHHPLHSTLPFPRFNVSCPSTFLPRFRSLRSRALSPLVLFPWGILRVLSLTQTHSLRSSSFHISSLEFSLSGDQSLPRVLSLAFFSPISLFLFRTSNTLPLSLSRVLALAHPLLPAQGRNASTRDAIYCRPQTSPFPRSNNFSITPRNQHTFFPRPVPGCLFGHLYESLKLNNSNIPLSARCCLARYDTSMPCLLLTCHALIFWSRSL